MLLVKSLIQVCCFIVSKIISLLFSVFPINNKKIFVYSYRGNKYACNQKSFSEWLLKNHPEEFEVVWGYRNNSTRDAIPPQFKRVKMISISYFYHLYTSKYVSTNQRVSFLDFFSKRKKQIYIQTWHASAALKRIEKEAENDLSDVYIREAKRDSKMADFLLSGSKQYTEVFKNHFWYDGEILEIGTMRNDCLFEKNQEVYKSIKSKYNLPLDKKIILYAPTFRNLGEGKGIDYNYDYGLDEKRIHDAFFNKIGDNLILLKQHPNLVDCMKESNQWQIDVTYIQDIQELLMISDVLISDYSSTMFDFMLTKKAMFIYANDFSTYTRDFTVNLEDMPCTIAQNNDELVEQISSFNQEEYEDKLAKFDREMIGSFEKGTANEEFYLFLQKR